ncbi:hypothetical protein [Chromobacterium sp. IIBBL 290-4]|uniref:hypothetical protein n=1 Tax=Chromobacterium sp. IIBBL 290-4 TaxID=2953890 RepID=UPI0020B8D4A3|nr:hypothetical protein [Chromobacterium sp. IIBBL 290-4]UTH76289.1 hypothetical protein NKT35_09375 [Chromobacterium sp. IIBBL 290-4]
MKELILLEIEAVNGGADVKQVAIGLGVATVGALAVAAAPVALGAGLAAASVGLGGIGAASTAVGLWWADKCSSPGRGPCFAKD